MTFSRIIIDNTARGARVLCCDKLLPTALACPPAPTAAARRLHVGRILLQEPAQEQKQAPAEHGSGNVSHLPLGDIPTESTRASSEDKKPCKMLRHS